ncbi:MAG: ABC transporter permease [Candidatus Aminicenantes bacterium]|nr:ABC transporter permease [Candidatus Aminicenantes bacterium]
MTIREKGYYNWDGELKSGGHAWLPIFLDGIKTAFKKKSSKIFFTFTISPFFIFLLGIYISTKPELKMLSEIVKLLKNDATFFCTFFTNGFLYFMLMILCIFIFAELISGDLKFNSFPLYFSRPLDRTDYVIGKFSIIMFYLLLFTLAPGILLVFFKILFTGQFAISPRVLLAIIVLPFLVSTFFASITLMVSSLSSNSRYVKLIIFLLFMFSNSISEMLKSIFKNTYFNLFSFARNVEQMGAYIFNTRPAFSAPGWMSLAIISGLIILSFFILFLRIGKSEAQIEIGS